MKEYTGSLTFSSKTIPRQSYTNDKPVATAMITTVTKTWKTVERFPWKNTLAIT